MYAKSAGLWYAFIVSERGAKGNDSLVVALDGDKLGQIGGMMMAIIVMVLCFFWRETDMATALVRTAWAFVIGYGGIFLFVRIILRTTLFEMLEQEHSKKITRLKRAPEPRPVTVDTVAAGEVTLDDLGLQPLTPRPEE